MNKSGLSRVLFALTFVILLGLSSPANAQYFYFGKNKVQYKEFEWKYVQSEHFDVYFSEGGEYLAKFTADVAESAYRTMRRDFRYEINNRIAIMVFESHNDFQQNNVVREYLDEGIGGVTELYKNRVVLPFEGDYKKFRHVIHHELVHAVMNDMIYGGSIQSALANNLRIQIPLWFSEGLAEYQSLEWDTNSDMFINDAIQNGYLPPIERLGGYFAYRGGQSVFRYISQKYGREKIGEIMQRLRATKSVEASIRGAIGLSIEELSERWTRDLKVQYWPEIARREDINAIMKKLTNHKDDGSNYNTSPAISPQGDKFAFITDRSGYFDIYVGSTINPNEFRRLVSGQRSPDFEELKILTPGITWSPDGKKIALATKAGESDAIMLIDVESGDTEKLTFVLDGIFSVSWSPDGKRLAFIGNQDFKSDIFVYNLGTKELVNLTNDVFSDSDPSWSKDGKKIFFSSDRRSNLTIKPMNMGVADGKYETLPATESVFNMRQYDYSQSDIYELSMETKTLRRLTSTESVEESSPVCSSDNQKLLFISDKNGIYNVYALNLNDPALANQDSPDPKIRPITNVLSGIRQISISADGTKLVGVGLDYAGFDIYMLRLPFERTLKADNLDANGNLIPTVWGKDLVQITTHKFSDVTQGLLLKGTVFGPAKPAQPGAFGISTARRDSTAKQDTAKAVAIGKPEAQPPQTEPELDLKNFVFDKSFSTSKEAQPEPDDRKFSKAKKKDEEIRDEKGDYKVKPYKLSFSPDIVYGNARYDALFGARGSALFSFSDLMGNHQIAFYTNLQIDLENSDYGVSYFYLPKRLDYGISAFHQARYIGIQTDDSTRDYYRYRIYGATGIASYPIDRFKRLEMTLGFLTLAKENLDRDFGNETVSFLNPGVSFIYDNTRPWLYSPISGTRYGISLSGALGGKIQFATILADYRTYYDFWKYYSFVMRFSGAYSSGKTPQKFFIGGTQNWINRKFENNVIPINQVQDFVFTTPAIPLRGYNYNRMNGTQFALANLEFRFPFLQYLAFGALPIPFYYLQGVIFTDIGSAWTGNDFRGVTTTPSGNHRLEDILWGYGWGFRTVLLVFAVRFDMAWSNNLTGSTKPIFYISLGGDF